MKAENKLKKISEKTKIMEQKIWLVGIIASCKTPEQLNACRTIITLWLQQFKETEDYQARVMIDDIRLLVAEKERQMDYL